MSPANPAADMPRFADHLPAVLREGDGGDFLRRFLRVFESLHEELQGGLDAIPDLFALTPTPALVADVTVGATELTLDSAAGLCPGDVLLIDPATEFVVVRAIETELLPRTITLKSTTRFAHTTGNPLRVVGAEVATTVLRAPLAVGVDTVVLADAERLGLAAGTVVRIGEGDEAEYALIAAVNGAVVRLVPPLQRAADPGQRVGILPMAATVTPPPAFAHAGRDGPALVLRADARAGESVLELDTLTGLAPGDVLHLREADRTRAEFVRVEALPPTPSVPQVHRHGLQLRHPLRFDHAAGLAVGVVSLPQSVTELDSPPQANIVELSAAGGGMAFLSFLAGWLGLALRPGRGERWNRELLRLAARIAPWRGTRVGVEAFLNAYLRGEARATVHDPANPMQLGLVSTVGVDTVVGGGPADTFWVDLVGEAGNSTLYHPAGLAELLQAAHEAIRREKPAHVRYDLRLRFQTMQLGVDPDTDVGARVGETTLLWDGPLFQQGHS